MVSRSIEVLTALVGLALILIAIPAQAESPALAHLNQWLSQRGGREVLSDNPANYAIYEKIDAVIRGMEKTNDNQADMVSYSNVEDGALGNMTDIEQRVRELLVQRSSGLMGSSDRDIIDSEISQLQEELLDTLKNAQFNTIPIFGPLLTDPTLTRLIADPARLTLEGVDSLLAYLSHQRAVVGARVSALDRSIQGDQTAAQNAQAVQEQLSLTIHLLMLH